MRPVSFEYHRATSVDHALLLLAEFGEDGRPLAGGQSLVPMMNLRLARPAHLVDINDLPLDWIEAGGSTMRIGALMRHQRYFTEPIIRERFAAFHEAVHWIGHPTIRLHGSFGGSLSHADPTAELPAVALLYDAVIVAASRAGERRIPAADFFQGAYVTDLRPGEMVVAAEFPIPPAASAGSFLEIGERRGDFATASVGVTIEFADGAIAKAAVVCSGGALTPVRAPETESFLVDRPLTDPGAAEAGQMFAAAVDPPNDHIASADYRRGLIAELTKRALESACGKALRQS
jgi:carbon-monoxide dehydrogenase medium subunit